MTTSKTDWSSYYELTKDQPPAPLLLRTLKYVSGPGQALDLGGGNLRDAKYLISQGFIVTVIDQDSKLAQFAAENPSPNLDAVVTTFDQYNFPVAEFDLIISIFSLPFNPPDTFDRVWDSVKKSLKPGGIYGGQFFGIHDAWNTPDRNMTFHTREQVMDLMSGLEIISLNEEERNGKTASGTFKHWHVFHVIAKKN